MRQYFNIQALKNGFIILKAALNGFNDDLGLKYSASLAFYTIFSIAPLLLLLISLAGLFFGQDAVQGKVFGQINGLVGNDAAKEVQNMIVHLELSGKSTISVIIGVVVLVMGATSVFGEIKESINLIWQVKPKPKVGWAKLLKDRFLSGSIIIALAFLLLVSLIMEGALLALSDKLKNFMPGITVLLFQAINFIIGFAVTAILFGVIFKVLPDAKIHWRNVRSGAIFTAVLFMIGRLVIGLYIASSGTSTAYGAAGSLIVILLWVYYTAVILYFGAEFTRAFANFHGIHIEPAEFAVHIEQKERAHYVQKIPAQHKIGKSRN